MFFWLVLLLILIVFLMGPSRCWVDRTAPLNYVLYQEPLRGYDAQVVNVWVDKPWSGSRIPCHLARYGDTDTLIIYSHGNNEDLLSCLPLVKKISDNLHSDVVTYDYSGYGLNPADTFERSERGVNATLEAVYEYFRSGYEKVVLWGYSLGSGPSLKLAAKSKVEGVVLVGAYSSILKVVEDKTNVKFARMFTERWDNASTIKDVPCPCILLHAEQDNVVPFAHAEKLKAQGGTNVSLVALKNSNHSSFNWDEVTREVELWTHQLQ